MLTKFDLSPWKLIRRRISSIAIKSKEETSNVLSYLYSPEELWPICDLDRVAKCDTALLCDGLFILCL